jgi:hypothetical protein
MSNIPPISRIPPYENPNDMTWEEVRSLGIDAAEEGDIPDDERAETATVLPFRRKTGPSL